MEEDSIFGVCNINSFALLRFQDPFSALFFVIPEILYKHVTLGYKKEITHDIKCFMHLDNQLNCNQNFLLILMEYISLE